MIISITWFICGLVILTIGAEGLVRGSSALALRLGISPLVIGLTIVAFGTSAPELAVSVEAAASGSSSISIGNVIGSNIANIALILGLAAMIEPMRVHTSLLTEQIPIMIGVSLLLWGMTLDGTIGQWDGVLLFVGIIIYNFYSYRSARSAAVSGLAQPLPGTGPALMNKTWFCLVLIVAGLAALAGGGALLVDSAVDIARFFNVSESLIGLTIVALGTSMPELATSVVAALRKQADIALGNIVGSNIFNILGILGVASLINPLSSTDFSRIDFALMVGIAILLLPMAWTHRRLGRLEGLFLFMTYIGYLYYLGPKT
ncbi:MAG: calcium/sodium antiporter [Gammaproteobacteria bacterium]|nr:calcium/sodium antiporter [Gammaproteobacteria bacterium]